MSTVEAEIIEDDFKAPVLKDIKYPVKTVELEKLLEEYSEVPDIDPESDDAGSQYQYVLKGHKAFVKARTSIEKVRKELKAPALEYGKKVDGIAKEFQGLILSTEQKLFIARKKVEDYEQLKQEEAERVELERIENIKAMIDKIKTSPMSIFNMDSDHIKGAIEYLKIPTDDIFEEFVDEAMNAYTVAMSQLQDGYDTKVKAEQADAIEAQRAKEAQELENKRQEELRIERESFEAEKAEMQRERDAINREREAQQEEINRQRAELKAEEIAKQQEIDRVNLEAKEKYDREQRAKENTRLHEKMVKEALEDMDDKTTDEILDAIVNGEVRHVFFGDGND